ncbi:LCP family protein required for cell wall assembly [Streptacidiphilus sp. MAP12-16]|uniref:LCP family protein n=1 Tax=Streptacidiphilus sp. MAP12-16 TaxID=3156300 RepID=UPI0035114663
MSGNGEAPPNSEVPPEKNRFSSVESSSETSTGESSNATSAGDASADAGAPRPRRRLHLLRWFALGLGLVLIAVSVTLWLGYQKLNHNIHTDTTTPRLLGPVKDRPTVAPIAYNAENILLIGSDSRAGANSSYGDPNGGARSDTTIVLHLSKDRKSAVAMSIPRDAMVHIPACELPDGNHTNAMFAQFNWAYSYGGTACTIRTVENLTGIRIDHFMVVDFNGFKTMVDAVGGVKICLAKPVADKNAQLYLPAGRQTINGTQALGFVRVRETIGDGSDTERMGRQQQFLSSLVQQAESSGVLFNPVRLFPLLNAVTSSITVDPGLNTVSKLYDLATSLRNMPSEQLVLLTAPREPYVNDSNRDQFRQPEADQLFAQIRNDLPVRLTTSGPSGSPAGSPSGSASGSPSAAATAQAAADAAQGAPSTSAVPSPSSTLPTFTGRTANQDICTSS